MKRAPIRGDFVVDMAMKRNYGQSKSIKNSIVLKFLTNIAKSEHSPAIFFNMYSYSTYILYVVKKCIYAFTAVFFYTFIHLVQ